MFHRLLARINLQTRLNFLFITLLVICLMLSPMQAQASSPSPNSMNFGYGARLDPLGIEIDLAINTAASIGLDWIGLDFDWAHLWPKEDVTPNLQPLDEVIKKASDLEIKILLSITTPPTWALTSLGPDVNMTTQLVTFLSSRYTKELMAIELFPGANTAKGWGAKPNPQTYKFLLEASWKALRASGSPVWLVAGGLSSSTDLSLQDINDLSFLKALYEAQASTYMPIISLRLPDLNSDVMASPNTGEQLVLRHYEDIRQIMRQYGHTQGSIWVTGFTWTSRMTDEVSSQSSWVKQAYHLMRSQLYIGAAFFDQLNPPRKSQSQTRNTWIQVEKGKTWLHPAVSALGELITLDKTGQHVSSNWVPYLKYSSNMRQAPPTP